MLIIAHRGASGEFPENTLLAIEQAIIQQADGIELDVQQHPNGELLLLHDRFLDNNTSLEGHFSLHSIEKIQKAALSSSHTATTLAEALALIAGRCMVNIELKSSSDDAQELTRLLNNITAAIDTAVHAHNFDASQFILSSFNHTLLKRCQTELPHIKRAALIACSPLELNALVAPLEVASVNPSVECINEDLIKQARDNGLDVWVYTVNQAFDIELCHALNVDAIFTDFPARTRSLLNSM